MEDTFTVLFYIPEMLLHNIVEKKDYFTIPELIVERNIEFNTEFVENKSSSIVDGIDKIFAIIPPYADSIEVEFRVDEQSYQQIYFSLDKKNKMPLLFTEDIWHLMRFVRVGINNWQLKTLD